MSCLRGVQFFEEANLRKLNETELCRLLHAVRMCRMRMPVRGEQDYDASAVYHPVGFTPMSNADEFAVRLFQLQAVHTLIRGKHLAVIAGTASGKSMINIMYWYYCKMCMQAAASPPLGDGVPDVLCTAEKPIGWDVLPTILLMRSQQAVFAGYGLHCSSYEPGVTTEEGITEESVLVSVSTLLHFVSALAVLHSQETIKKGHADMVLCSPEVAPAVSICNAYSQMINLCRPPPRHFVECT